MVFLVNGDAENSGSHVSSSKSKRQKVYVFGQSPQDSGQNAPPVNNPQPKKDGIVFAYRKFPQGCGRNAPRVNPQPVKDVVVASMNEESHENCGGGNSPRVNLKPKMDGVASALRTFPAGCGRNAPRVNSQAVKEIVLHINEDFHEDSGQNASRVNLQLKMDGVVSALRTFPAGCGRNAPRVKVKSKKDGVVSPNREFTNACGRYAPLIPMKSNEGFSDGSVKNLKVETDGAYVEQSSVGHCGSVVYVGNFEVTESSDLPKALISEPTTVLEVLNQVEPERMKVLKPLVVDGPKSLLDMMELLTIQNSPQVNPTPMKCGGVSVSKNFQAGHSVENLKVETDSALLEPPRVKHSGSSVELWTLEIIEISSQTGPDSKDLLKSAFQPEEKELSSNLVQSRVDSVFPETGVQLKISDQPQASDPVEVVENHMHNKYPPRRRISACRDFPQRCGINTSCSILEIDSFRDPSVGDEKASGQIIMEQIVRDDVKQKMDKIEDADANESRLQGNIVVTKEIVEEAQVQLLGEVEKEMDEHVHIREVCESKLKQADIALLDEDDCIRHNNEDGSPFTPLVQTLQDLSVIPLGLHSSVDKNNDKEGGVTRTKVRETLRLFQGVMRKLLQDAESKSTAVQANGPGRVDLLAAKMLKEKDRWVNTGKQILGDVPGVEVGDEFHYRSELAVIGLHRPFQSGIDYLSRRNGTKLATSVVSSGGYADVMDSSDVLIYSGQGGLPTGGNKIAEDQKLERGNLSLKNSIDEGNPVRVIHGFKETKGNSSSDSRGKVVFTTYIYDGLYKVERYWEEIGSHGTKVFKFQLRRIPGQPELAVKELKKSKKLRVREGLCVDDISHGKEKMPIAAINTVDDEKPPPFEYITNMIYPSWCNLTPPEGCECTDGCSDSEKCFCAGKKNGGEIPFNCDGAIVQAKPLVYECGPSCKCPPSCYNRVSQRGIKFQLEIFKTESRGWGVRSLTSIPSGSFICEYTGELLQDKEAEQRASNDEYLFDIGQNYNDQALWEGLSNMIPLASKSSSSCEFVKDVDYTIDAANCGSVGRFINHSCSPNLYAQNVLYDHDDKGIPHIMLFAAENIPPLQELAYHYNYVLDQVLDSNGNIKKKSCYCGSLECTGRMY